MKNGLITTILLAAALCACSSKEYLSWNRPVKGEEGFSHDMIVLGEQLSDPYSVENMSRALQAVDPLAAGRGTLDATDFYVRFLPRDESELQMLLDKGLLLIDHPLDYRIIREGDWYHDPDLPEGVITWQYAVVPVDFEFPRGVRYERIDDCFIADHAPGTRSDGIDWDAVEREAFRLSGNAGMLPPATKGDSLSHTPRGRIAIMDPDFSNEPVGVKGVRVCCNSFVKIATAYTDEDGNYRMSKSFAGKVRYRLLFQNSKGFCQGVNLVLVPASTSALGQQPSEGYSITLDSSSDSKMFARCVVNNAGYDYLEACSSDGLPAFPKELRVWNLQLLDVNFSPMLHQGVLLETYEDLKSMLGNYAPLVKILWPDVLLGLSGASGYAEIYARALHAFAHAGHFSLAGKEWWNDYVLFCLNALASSSFRSMYGSEDDEGSAYCDLAESYAFYCQNVLYRRHYPETSEFFGTGSWFSPQLFMHMEERGLVLDKIAPLMTSNVTDMEVMKNKLLSYYPEYKSVITEAFVRYDK